MHDSSKLTGPEWERLSETISDSEELADIVEKIEANFVSERWYRCPTCEDGWIGPVMNDEDRIESCRDCGSTGRINTYGEVSFRDFGPRTDTSNKEET